MMSYKTVTKHFFLFVHLVITVFIFSSTANALGKRNNRTCGIENGMPLTNAYGPWDATKPEHRDKLPIVLGAHFTPEVESLLMGNRGSIMGDIDYTLRAIPNYHRALASMSKYQRQKNTKLSVVDDFYTAECYFERALYMQPNDPVALMLYGIHLHYSKEFEKAESKYLAALAINPFNVEVNYNIGLLYIELQQLEKAKKHAEEAYRQGYPLQGLKNRLEKVGITLEI